MALGDGWAVVSVDDAAQVRLLNGGSGPALGRVEAGAVSIDGVRTLAWQNAEGTHVGRVDGLPLTAPRLLAAHDADVVRRGQTWRPQFDFTAAVVAGVVEVHHEAGALVTSLPTKAAVEGSVRGLTWNARDLSGAPVPASRYAWTLRVEGADGTGPAVSVDGTGVPSGTVTIA